MQKNHCDICGKETFIAPESEPQFEMRDVTVSIPDPEKPGTEKEVTVQQRMPKMTTRKQMNNNTGVIEEVAAQEVKDLQERSYYLQLTLGGEYVIRDVCRPCLEEHIMPLARPLWDKLASLKEKE